MAEIRSALSDRPPLERTTLRLEVATGQDLVQFAAWPSSFRGASARLADLLSCSVPADTRTAASAGATTIFRVGPERLWITVPLEWNLSDRLRDAFPPADAVVTGLGHSRTILNLAGDGAADLLARGIAVDLDASAFPPGRFAQTRLHHTSVLLHRLRDDSFDLYVPRSYALAIWDWFAATLRTFQG